ncbi:MAG: ribosomal protein L13e [Candidatus Bathyarchaeota archaeon]|nr:ribosomal protein L13e [Candidatus Bathyarchaeota archaeon]
MHHVKPQIFKSDGRQRSGRGFSLQELKQAGLNVAEAKRLGFPVDKRRKTMHEQNVNVLKDYMAKKKVEVKSKAKPAAQRQSNKKAKS